LEVAGVDIMKGIEGKSFVIEANGNYGYHIEEITKDDISTPLIKYCERNHVKGREANQNSTMALFGFAPIQGLAKTETISQAINRIQNEYLK
jgi:hypothetical protein